VQLEIARPVPPRLAEIAPSSTEFPTPSLTSRRRPATSDTDPTSNRKIPEPWVSILPVSQILHTAGSFALSSSAASGSSSALQHQETKKTHC
jgi:hypothetical protein